MPTNTLRPNGLISDSGGNSIVGAASHHAATSDNSDSSYSVITGGTIRLNFGTFTLPAGSKTKSIRLRARARDNGVSPRNLQWRTYLPSQGDNSLPATVTVTPLTGSFTTYAGAEFAVSLTQAQINEIAAFWTTYSEYRLAELYLDVVHATQPVVDVTSPTGSPTITDSTQPTFTWDYTQGTDGGPQSRYRVKVFTAAQYGAGGFDPTTSDAFYDSGEVIGGATSHQSGPLDNSTTYRVYVRAAQTTVNQAHWSAWDFEQFSIAVDTADVDTVSAVAVNAAGKNTVTVDRVALSEPWETVDVQRSVDAGTTWSYVRGGQNVLVTDPDEFVLDDYETGNNEFTLYRARASYVEPGGSTITGAWVQSAAAVAWTAPLSWLKDPHNPTVNMMVRIRSFPEPVRQRRQGVFSVLGRPDPITVSDVQQLTRGEVTFQTSTLAEATAMRTLLEASVVLLQMPPSYDFGSRYLAVGNVQESTVDKRMVHPHRRFTVPYVEVVAPADATTVSV